MPSQLAKQPRRRCFPGIQQGFQRVADGFVHVGTYDGVQLAVQIFLDQKMVEAVARNGLRSDDGFHPRRQNVPVKLRAGHPTAVFIPDQIAALLQAAQQLGGEEGVAAGLAQQLAAELLVQPVGFAIQQGVDKRPSRRPAQIDLIGTEDPLQFVDDADQRMRLPVVRLRHVPRPVRAQNQDARPVQLLPQMKEQIERTAVDPLQIIHQQQQRPFARQRRQQSRKLHKKVGLRQRRGRCIGLHQLRQLRQPGHLVRRSAADSDLCPRQQRRGGDKAIQQGTAVLHQRLGHLRQRIP